MVGRTFGAVLAFGLILSVGASSSRNGWAASQHPRHSIACIFDRMTLRTAPGTCRPQARAYPAHVHGAVRRAVYDSSLTFGIPYKVLLAIGRCESDLNPHARNGQYFGLFQFAAQTFHRAAHSLATETGIAARSYWNPLDSSYAAGYMFATGRSWSWSCETLPKQVRRR